MDRSPRRSQPVPAWLTWVVVGIVMAGLVVASSSDTVRVWTNPEPTADETPAAAVADEAPPEPADEPTEHDAPAWLGTILQVLAVALFAAVVVAGAMTVTSWRPWLRHGRRRRMADDDVEWDEPLPESESTDVAVDVDTAPALAALSDGPPRNAIVACWIELEREAASAGLRRRATETSAEYAERVIGRALVDPAPITELAALYREARYSRHALTDDHRSRAADALARVEQDLAPRSETAR